MSLRFAPARSAQHSPVARALRRRVVDCVANDDADTSENQRMMRAALEHFSQHGLNAARAARAEAEAAFFAGDRARYDRWVGICRILDRRLAAELATLATSKSA